MATKSKIAKEKRRIKTVSRFANKRAKLKSMTTDMSISEEERLAAHAKLQRLPRNASPVRVQQRCQLCGRPHSVYRKFGLCRLCLRKFAMLGQIPGLVKSSW